MGDSLKLDTETALKPIRLTESAHPKDSTTTALKPIRLTESAHQTDSTTTALKPIRLMESAQETDSPKEPDALARKSPRTEPPRLSARRVKPPSRPADAHARRLEEPRNARRERCSVSPDQRPSAELDLLKPDTETALKPTRLTESAHHTDSTTTALKPTKLTESAH